MLLASPIDSSRELRSHPPQYTLVSQMGSSGSTGSGYSAGEGAGIYSVSTGSRKQKAEKVEFLGVWEPKDSIRVPESVWVEEDLIRFRSVSVEQDNATENPHLCLIHNIGDPMRVLPSRGTSDGGKVLVEGIRVK